MMGPRPCLGVSAGSFALGVDGLFKALSRACPSADEPVENPVDRADIAATLRGDGDAYRRLVERHQKEIASMMWRFARDGRRVEELVQDVFVEAYTSLRSFKGRAPFSRWLRKIAIRVGYRHWKRLARVRKEVPLDDLGELASRAEDVEPGRAAELLHGLLAKLPPRDRLVLTLFYLEGHSVAEVADLTGWSRVMVKVQAHRARGKLKRLVEKELGGERWTSST